MVAAYFDRNEEICQAILDGVVDAFAATSYDLPSRRTLGYAGMPIDCDMLAVFVARMFPVNQDAGPDSEGQAVHRCTFWSGTDVNVLLVRCSPQPKGGAMNASLVPAGAVTAFSKMSMADPHIIARGVLDTWKAGLLGVGANVTFLATTPQGSESGGLVGISAGIRVGNVF